MIGQMWITFLFLQPVRYPNKSFSFIKQIIGKMPTYMVQEKNNQQKPIFYSLFFFFSFFFLFFIAFVYIELYIFSTPPPFLSPSLLPSLMVPMLQVYSGDLVFLYFPGRLDPYMYLLGSSQLSGFPGIMSCWLAFLCFMSKSHL